MGLEATVDFDFRKLFREYEQVGRRGSNLVPVFRRLKPLMIADQKENFKRQQGPAGRWDRKAASTRARRGGRKLLGKLSTAFDVTFDRTEIRAQSKVPWSGVHQEGGKVGNNATVPARVHHWMSIEFLRFAEREIGKHVFGKFGTGR